MLELFGVNLYINLVKMVGIIYGLKCKIYIFYVQKFLDLLKKNTTSDNPLELSI